MMNSNYEFIVAAPAVFVRRGDLEKGHGALL